MRYQPIENYGVIGDQNTVALVGLNGSIDFMCFPDFDSPTIFCRLLDADKGGFFAIEPPDRNVRHKQMYIPDTNVLLTRFLSEDGVGEITDFMPVAEHQCAHVLIRRVTQVRGEETYKMRCAPRVNYAQSEHHISKEGKAVYFTSFGDDQTILKLVSSVPLSIDEQDAVATFTLAPGETADFALEHISMEVEKEAGSLQDYVTSSMHSTMNYWKDWMSRSKYRGRWQEVVNRSALVLKLLTSHRYGSIVAAPTFGLPEKIGDNKNWDYRYNWIRDSSFTLYALIRLGYTKEAGRFFDWLQKQCEGLEKPGGLHLMYGIDGRRDLTEETLDHLEGYKGSRPVRIGNGAYDQLQLDIYGELMDSIYLYDKFASPVAHQFWVNISRQIDWVCENWQLPDEGIWEVRGGRRQFLYSRLLCWVAVDRGVRLGRKRSLPTPTHWKRVRDEIYRSIFEEFWDPEQRAFVQYKGSKEIDASCLLMPLIRFVSPTDPQWLETLKAIEEQLVSDSLVYRYSSEAAADVTGLEHGEGTFSLCSFWYVECLARAGFLDKARFYFEKMLGYANHLGLYSEQIGFHGEHLGNFPQGFTHLGLISAAYYLNRAEQHDH